MQMGISQAIQMGVNLWIKSPLLSEQLIKCSKKWTFLKVLVTGQDIRMFLSRKLFSILLIYFGIYMYNQYNYNVVMSYRCALHSDMPITHFCQSCKDLVCQKCTTKQPHSGINHTIKPVEDSANVRKNLYTAYIQTEINPIRSQSQKKISNFQLIKKQTQRDKKVIEKDIKIQFQAINNRLLDKQSLIVIQKQTGIKNLQNYVHTFDDLSNAFDSIYQNPQAVLLSYKTFEGQIKKLQFQRQNLLTTLQKNVNQNLKRQFKTILNKSLAHPQYQQRNKFINKVINDFVKNYKSKLESAKQNNKKLGKQIQHTYNDTFKKVVTDQVAKICIFCQLPFTIDNANEPCSNNRTYKINCTYSDVNWETVLPPDARGTKRHYWYRCESIHRKKPDLNAHSLKRKSGKKYYWNGLLELQVIKHILINREIDQGTKFINKISKNDPEKTGYISKVAFVYTLSKIYLLPKSQVDCLVDMLLTEKGINYQKFIEILEKPTEQYIQYVKEQQQMQKAKPIAPQTTSYSKYRY